MILSTVRKKDENGNDVDLEIKFGVEDLRRVLELGDSDNDPTIIPERLCKGLWCRMGFTCHINGKMIKTLFSHAYKFMIHCMVHSLSHRKGAYEETSDYIMNIITSLVLNRRYNVSQVIFEYLKENIRAGSTKYIMYRRFIQMMINDQFKDIPKDNGDILDMRNMTSETIARLTKGTEEGAKRMICRIKNPAYIAPENDRWRHDNSSSDNEDERISELVEKKTRWWFVRDGKRKRTPKTTPVVPIQKKSIPKILVKGPSKEPQQRLVNEQVLDPSNIPQEGVDLAKVTFDQYLQHTAAATQKDKTSSAQGESVKEKESEDLKKKPSKKQKASDEEDSTYVPTEKPKKLRAKRKAVQYGVLPRKVRAKKSGAPIPKDQEGKKEKHVTISKVQEAEKAHNVEAPKDPEVQTQSVPEVEVQQKTSGDDYVEISGFRDATPPPPPPPEDQPIHEAPEGVPR
ncbi:hypothetical protein Hanom_Chr06g00536441 [Helianthus anomalus]